MPEGFVKIRSYWSPDQANLAKLHLESYGIPVELEGATMVATAWLDANAVGGVKLLVSAQDADRATEILDSHEPHNQDKSNSSASDTADWQTGDEFGEDSSDTEHKETGEGVLTDFRSLKRPLIWLFLGMMCAPFLLWLAYSIASLFLLV
jgi:hypothetical protein